MEKFNYVATSSKENKKVTGIIEAVTQIQAQSILRSKGYFIISLNKIEMLPSWMRWWQSFNRVRSDDVVHFTRQLSTMINAGLPLTTALSILKYQTNLSMAKVVDEVLKEVEGGGSFYKALSKFERIFSPVYLSLIRSGEAAGVLEKVLKRLSLNLEKQAEFRAKTKNALIYPAIITMAMIAVSAVMMIFVVPKLTSLYSEFGAELPTPTRILIGVSNFMVKTWYLFLFLTIGGIYALITWKKTPAGPPLTAIC